jgi:hypothetical protein
MTSAGVLRDPASHTLFAASIRFANYTDQEARGDASWAMADEILLSEMVCAI